MDKKEKENMLCGEITAFLSVVFLLILALTGTTLEAARIQVGESFADRSVQNALESLYTEYCIPLWEDYHLFFLEGEANEEKDKEYIKNSVSGYMESTYNTEAFGMSTMNLLDMEISEVQVTDIVRADEEEGELLCGEIIAYEKYQVDELFLGKQKTLVETMKEVEASQTVIEKQMEAEEKMAEVNLEMLKFMSAIEGISVGKHGFLWMKNGLLKTEDHFVKQFCNSQVSQNAVGVGHEVVWKSLKESYQNPVVLLEEMEAEASLLLAEEIEKEARKAALAQGNSGSGAADTTKQAGRSVTGGGSYIKLKYLEGKFIETTKGILTKANKAQRILSELRAKQTVFGKEAEEFVSIYGEQKENLSAESQRVFEEEIERLLSYAAAENGDSSSSLGRVLGMESVLKSNIEILKEITQMKRIGLSGGIEGISSYISGLADLKRVIKGYQIQQLQFDYNFLSEKRGVEDPTEALTSGYENKLLELVVKDISEISKKRKLRHEVEKLNHGMQEAENLVEEALEGVLLSYYIQTHFNTYLGQVSEKETGLAYEMEYLLGGELTDKDNLEEVIKKLTAFRTILNYLYLRTDREKAALAYETAVALAGYTCMEPLILLTQNLILMTWATEEAIVDTAALLQGKEIPVFKSKATFLIRYEELLVFGRELVQKKAEEMKEICAGSLCYEEYLYFLLCNMEKAQKLRGIMELIQDNIRLRYDAGFVFENCIYGSGVSVTFSMEEKFVRLPGVRYLLTTTGDDFGIRSSQNYCYK